MGRKDHFYDGSWYIAGLHSMMVGLDDPDFVEDQSEDFVEDKEKIHL